jgi:uncharacterized Rmd1/YagE family protein
MVDWKRDLLALTSCCHTAAVITARMPCALHLTTKPNRCVAYLTASSYDMLALQLDLQKLRVVPASFEDVLHVHYDLSISTADSALMQAVKSHGSANSSKSARDAGRDVFFFSDGTFVCWGTNPEEDKEWVKYLEPFGRV